MKEAIYFSNRIKELKITMIEEGKCPVCHNILKDVKAEIYAEICGKETKSSYVDMRVRCNNCNFKADVFVNLSSLKRGEAYENLS